MPFEERHILFYLNELEDIFLEQKFRFKNSKDIKPADVNITEVAHTSRIDRIPPEQLARFSELVDIPKNNSTTVFYRTKKKKLQKVKTCFLVPASVLIEIFKKSCIEKGISLPRIGDKSIIATNLIVGLRIRLSSTSIALEA